MEDRRWKLEVGGSELPNGRSKLKVGRSEKTGGNVAAMLWSVALSRWRSTGFGKMATAPEALASSEGDQAVTRMTRAVGSFETILRQAVTPFSFGIRWSIKTRSG